MENSHNNFQFNNDKNTNNTDDNQYNRASKAQDRSEKVFNKIIYPHIDKSQQRKTTKFIFCYYSNLVDLRRFNDEGFNKFNNHLISFIMKSNSDKLIAL